MEWNIQVVVGVWQSWQEDQSMWFSTDWIEIDPNMRNSIIFKLELKGIGSTGQKLDKILKKGIFGY